MLLKKFNNLFMLDNIQFEIPNKDLLNARIEEIGDLMQKEADATNQLVN